MAKRPIYRVSVARKYRQSPNMLRLLLAGEDLSNFPGAAEGDYVKFVLPKPGVSVPLDLTQLDLAQCWKRSFTVRQFDAASKRLTLDVMAHAEGGPATRWINAAQVGTELMIAGPGPVQRVDPTSDWVFLVGDMTSLPAIAVNLEQLPADAMGYAVIEVVAEEDRLPLRAPPGVRVQWLVHPDPGCNSPLIDRVRELQWLPGRGCFWAAGELSSMTRLRQYWVKERGVSKADLYLSSYWKLGAADEQHKLLKKQQLG